MVELVESDFKDLESYCVAVLKLARYRAYSHLQDDMVGEAMVRAIRLFPRIQDRDLDTQVAFTQNVIGFAIKDTQRKLGFFKGKPRVRTSPALIEVGDEEIFTPVEHAILDGYRYGTRRGRPSKALKRKVRQYATGMV